MLATVSMMGLTHSARPPLFLWHVKRYDTYKMAAGGWQAQGARQAQAAAQQPARQTKQEKKDRLKKMAENKNAKAAKPMNLKFGLNHVTTLVEENKAKLVIIAHDVDPIECMVHLPALCRRKNVPYCFLRGKAALGKLCHMKTATCVALTEVNREDMQDLEQLSVQFREQYNNNDKQRKHWGGGIMGIKNQHMIRAREKLREIELAKKANM